MSFVIFAGKKGVSPLIATVLLIAFAVALGAVIMNWGKGFVQDRTADIDRNTKIETGCALDVAFRVADRRGTPQLCYAGSGTQGYIEFTLENNGKKDIKKVALVIEGELGIYQNNSLNGTAMIAGIGASKQNISYSYTQYGAIEYVRFTPVIDIAGIDTACGGSSVQLDIADLRNCSAA